jgi:hypothetical protein
LIYFDTLSETEGMKMEDAALNMDILGPVIGILFIAAFTGLVIWIVRHQRGAKMARETFLSGLGFTKIPPELELLSRLDQIYRRNPTQKFEVPAAFRKQTAQGMFYIFDLLETSGDENIQLGSNSLAVISADLKLSRFLIAGRMQFTRKAAGWMINAAEKVIGWAASQGGFTRLDLAEFPEIDQKLMVLSDEEYASREFLTRERLARLTWLADPQRLSEVASDGDCFVIKRSAPPARSKMETELLAILDDAQKVWVALV